MFVVNTAFLMTPFDYGLNLTHSMINKDRVKTGAHNIGPYLHLCHCSGQFHLISRPNCGARQPVCNLVLI